MFVKRRKDYMATVRYLVRDFDAVEVVEAMKA